MSEICTGPFCNGNLHVMSANRTSRAAGTALFAITCIVLASCRGAPGTGHPDLVVESPSVSGVRAPAWKGFTFSATVRNTGDRAAAKTTLRVFHSTDATITTFDREVGAAELDKLSAAATSSKRLHLSAPSNSGTHYFGACVDPVADESDTANNCSASVPVTVAAHPVPPDLVVGARLVSDDNPAAGAAFTLSVTVRNAGGAPAAATTLRFFGSTDATITASDTQVGSADVEALDAAAASEERVDLNARASHGTYYYGACVDPVTNESDTTNNCSASVPVTVVRAQAPRPRPDLQVVSPSVSNSNPAIGGVFTVYMEVRNAGAAPAAATTMRFYRSLDATITRSDTQVGTEPVALLEPADYVTPWEILQTPSSKGIYYYGACVDPVAGDSDPTNNCSAAVRIKVSHNKPNLQIDQVNVFNSGAPVRTGKSFGLMAGVRNLGGPSAATTVRFHLLPQGTTDPSAATEVGTDAVPELAGDKRRAYVETRPTAPSVGTYFYLACVDPPANESNKQDNCLRHGNVYVHP